MTIRSIYCVECDEQITYEANEDGEVEVVCSSFYCPLKEVYNDDDKEELDFNT